jgi:transcription antitermination factor NusG
MCAASNPRWYALHVKPRYEKITSTLLRNKGYEEFLPLRHERRRWSDRIAEVDFPLFPGYVFCRVDLRDRRAPIVTTPGVLKIVGLGPTPTPVHDAEIAAVEAIVNSKLPAEPWPYIAAGQSVRIEQGPLAGIEGVFLETRKQHRLVVSVTLLQRSVAVEIDTAWVSPLTA